MATKEEKGRTERATRVVVTRSIDRASATAEVIGAASDNADKATSEAVAKERSKPAPWWKRPWIRSSSSSMSADDKLGGSDEENEEEWTVPSPRMWALYDEEIRRRDGMKEKKARRKKKKRNAEREKTKKNENDAKVRVRARKDARQSRSKECLGGKSVKNFKFLFYQLKMQILRNNQSFKVSRARAREMYR